jgi:hypothetical protein
MRQLIVRLALGFATVLVGCRFNSEEPDSSGDTGVDDAEGTTAAIDPAPMVEALERAATLATLIAGPLVRDARLLEEMGDSADDDATIRQRIRNAVATNSIVDDAACVRFNWNLRRVVITFDECTSEHTGLTIDGQVTLSIRLQPVRLAMTFSDLTIDDVVFDGVLNLRVQRADGTFRFIVGTDLTFATEAAQNQVVLTGVTLALDPTDLSATLGGDFSIDALGVSASGTLVDLRWVLPDCHPSSGTARFIAGSLTSEVTFLPTTPDDGNVTIRVPPLPPATTTLLRPCAEYFGPPAEDAGTDGGIGDGAVDDSDVASDTGGSDAMAGDGGDGA